MCAIKTFGQSGALLSAWYSFNMSVRQMRKECAFPRRQYASLTLTFATAALSYVYGIVFQFEFLPSSRLKQTFHKRTSDITARQDSEALANGYCERHAPATPFILKQLRSCVVRRSDLQATATIASARACIKGEGEQTRNGYLVATEVR